MKPAPPETAELLQRVRQQLILAQVRLMELEDARDELAPKLAGTEQLLAAAQSLADQKIDEAAHLAKVSAELQEQYEHLRHIQHVTNEALNETRSHLTAASASTGQLQQEMVGLSDQATQLYSRLDRVALELAESHSTAATRLDRLNQLDAELRAMKATRSWRWTAWLRRLGR
ncbi:MAG: hypothetical protein JWQ83_2132 [Lacunisphaera sp.]|nr:hypothetical protein [Lacunisphaera sp.]